MRKFELIEILILENWYQAITLYQWYIDIKVRKSVMEIPYLSIDIMIYQQEEIDFSVPTSWHCYRDNDINESISKYLHHIKKSIPNRNFLENLHFIQIWLMKNLCWIVFFEEKITKINENFLLSKVFH